MKERRRLVADCAGDGLPRVVKTLLRGRCQEPDRSDADADDHCQHDGVLDRCRALFFGDEDKDGFWQEVPVHGRTDRRDVKVKWRILQATKHGSPNGEKRSHESVPKQTVVRGRT